MKSLEFKTTEDYENLRALGYDRIAIFEYYVEASVAVATLMNSANYGYTCTLTDTGANLTFAKLFGHLGTAIIKWLKNVRDNATKATRYDIADNGAFGPVFDFAQEFVKGYLNVKISDTPSDSWLEEAGSGSLTAGSTTRLDRTHVTETGSEDWMRLIGYYGGLCAPKLPDVTSISSDGVAEKRLTHYLMLQLATIILAIPALCVIQTEIAKMQIGRKLGVVPPEFDVIQKNDVDDRWLFMVEGRHAILDQQTGTNKCVNGATNYIDWDFSYLPSSGLIDLIRKRARNWRVPVGALNVARTMFGIGFSEDDFPTNFASFFNISDEQDVDAKKVGYGLQWAMWFLDEFFGEEKGMIPKLWDDVLRKDHWTYKKLKDLIDPTKWFTNFNMGTLKGYIDNSMFTPLKWHFRGEDETITAGNFSNPRLMQTTDPLIAMALNAPDGVTALYARGGWTPSQVGSFLLYELLFMEGEADLKCLRESLYAGQHYYVRKNETINYVMCDTGSTNIRFGAKITHNSSLQDQFGLTLEDITQGWTQKDINTRLPGSRYPIPTFIEDIYKMDNVKSVASLIMAPLISASSVSSTPAPDGTLRSYRLR